MSWTRRAYLVRMLYSPSARGRVGSLLVGLGALLYLGRAAVQLTRLGPELPASDFPWFYAAARDAAAGRDLYAPFLDRCPGIHWCFGGYIYPPLLAELLRPLAGLDVVSAEAAWLVLCHLMLIATAAVAWRALRADMPRGAGLVLLAASLFFLPVYQNLAAGSVGAPLLLVLTLAAAAVLAGRDHQAGTWLAVGAVLRVSPAALGPVLLRTRAQLRRPVGVVAAILVGLALLIALQAVNPFTLEYFQAVLPRVSAGTDFVSNVSLPAVVLRVERALSGGRLETGAAVSLVLTVAVIALTWWKIRGLEGRGARAVSYAAMLAATTLVAGVTWNYHLMTELLVIALLIPWIGRGRHGATLALVSYPLLWVYSDGILAATGFRGEGAAGVAGYLAITSLNAAGMVLLWLACLDVLAGLRRVGADASPAA